MSLLNITLKKICFCFFILSCFSSYGNQGNGCEELINEFASTGGEPVYIGNKNAYSTSQFLVLRLAALLRNPQALRELGMMYLNGAGVPQNYKKALRLFKRAARLGSEVAKGDIALMYTTGNGVKQDDEQAFYWAQPSAEAGVATSLWIVGGLYLEGQVVQKDEEKAFRLIKKAAELGFIEAKHSVGMMYANGIGVKQDDEQAFYWLEQAALQGHRLARYPLGMAYANGKGVAKNNIQAYKWLVLYKDSPHEQSRDVDLEFIVGSSANAERQLSKLESEMTADQIQSALTLVDQFKAHSTVEAL